MDEKDDDEDAWHVSVVERDGWSLFANDELDSIMSVEVLA